MCALNYKTRGDSSPAGKARVFFTCHPTDFPLCFRRITDDILEQQNCAIWYLNPEEEPDPAQYEADLEQMQLFVIPVTARFLKEPNRARLADFPYAAAHHKPVLPIMMESGLSGMFNNVCGDLQAVDIRTDDVTATPYEERLSTFLKSVLIGNEQEEKIRQAFDTYIFLSYRKIDRAYAQNLMKLIHRNEFCRDIAIWYDEFLVPGESFNDAIRNALQKSPLFALAVTPSLLMKNDEGEDNYVMRTEYPMARDSGKIILPFELQPTDPEALKVRFPGIGEDSGRPCVSAEDAKAVAKALEEAIGSIVFSTKKKDAAHTFFIGLAYLGGVDVEVDQERAAGLIRKAADEGLPEAMEKLVSMYRYGEAVRRDYAEAIRWQEKLAGRRLSTYEADPTDENGRVYVSALTGLVNQLLDQRRTEEAKQACERIYAFCVPLQDEKVWAQHAISWEYGKQGELNRLTGNYIAAQAYLKKNIEVLRNTLLDHPGNSQLMRSLGINLNHYGKNCQTQKQTEEAARSFSEALGFFEKLDAQGSTLRTRRDTAVTLGLLGNCYYLERDVGRAKRCYDRMLEINRAAMAETGTHESIRDYAVSLNKQGLVRMLTNDLQDAASWYLKEADVSRELAEKTGFFESWKDLGIAYDSLRQVYETQENLTEAKVWAEKYTEIAEKLEQLMSGPESKEALRRSWGNLGLILGNLGQIVRAEECLRKAMDSAETVARTTNAVQDVHALAMIAHNLGLASGDRAYIRYACDLWSQLQQVSPRFAQYLQMAENSLRN